ncbi:COR domain-containing protein [Mucilaginibacter sp.]|uniref:COR domain-containing protein n=1 Tax=Mucilaginibacter sp. TaxID=1882438 RepID=UPI0025E58ECA|nr:COR domain-containing protein [Mucilaginibacter sp.]
MIDYNSIKKIEELLKQRFFLEKSTEDEGNSYYVDESDTITRLSVTGCDLSEFDEFVNCLKDFNGLEDLRLNNDTITNISSLRELENLTSLYLSGITSLDISSIIELKKLRLLSLYSNKVINISSLKKMEKIESLTIKKQELIDISFLSNLNNLRHLNLSQNKIKDISPLRKLSQLEILTLESNHISDVYPLKELTKLNDLRLNFNKISDITSLKELINLHHLSIHDNQIENLSPLENLCNLESLYLKQNKISNIEPLRKLFKLELLLLYQNRIKDISALKDLKKLSNLGLNDNQIEYLPPWITKFTMRIGMNAVWKHGFITLNGNPLKSPPQGIVQQGKKAIKNYFNQIEKEKGKIEYLFEAKLLVIGEGGAGKTTFTRKIIDLNAKMPNEKDTTLGIEIGKWTFDSSHVLMSGKEDVKFHVNLWDFGGQKIYQGTHQIFFSDKSFYVLLSDTREQKTDFSYWLNTVEQLGGAESSLIIVLNKKFGHESKIDESGYRSHFGMIIKDVIELDLKNDVGNLVLLQERVKLYLKDLPGIGDPLPSSWVDIRDDLSHEKLNFISFDRFKEICQQRSIDDPSILHTLSGYFNRIGAFTHYIDDPLLQERIYLNSNWLVKTVYEVLDNELAKSKKGRVNGLDIKRIWINNELHYEVNKLTQLMHKFGLMYHIPDTDDYVIPAHLPTVTPYKKWGYSSNSGILQFTYEFDKFMPQGIMSRLIVSLNHHIKNHDLVWHRGVNVEYNGTYAEIIESYGGNNRFEIRIVGGNKIELLAIIRERFAEVLKPFNNLKYKQLVPCICEECKDSTEPAFHDYHLLLKFKEKGTGSQCSKTGEIIIADELLKIIESSKKTLNLDTSNETAIRTVKIFLASSSELTTDRKEFREFISVENDRLHKKGIYLEVVQWEYFIDSMSKQSLQTEYNNALKDCDIFVSLFFSKVGKYTTIEFENAFGEFKRNGRPLIYTFFKNATVDYNLIKKADINSKFKLEEKLKRLGHFKTIYKDLNDLKNQFKRQLEYFLDGE